MRVTMRFLLAIGAYVPRQVSRRPARSRESAPRTQARRQANLRLARTVVLGSIAVLLAIVWLGDQYGIDREETLRYLGGALGFVGALTLLGITAGALLVGVRWLLARRATADREKND